VRVAQEGLGGDAEGVGEQQACVEAGVVDAGVAQVGRAATEGGGYGWPLTWYCGRRRCALSASVSSSAVMAGLDPVIYAPTVKRRWPGDPRVKCPGTLARPWR